MTKKIALNAPAFPESKFLMKPFRILGLVLALSASCGAPAVVRADSLASIFTNVTKSTAGQPRRPSIIFIRCNGLGCGDLSCYGQTNYFTPNLDRLAANGMRFTGFHSGNADFTGGLAALMTGKNAPFAPGSKTLAERLQAVGYYTGLIGEWTLGPKPWTQGFNNFGGFISEDEGRDYYADHLWRFSPHSLFDPTNKVVSDYVGREMIYQNTGGRKGRWMPQTLMDGILNFTRDEQPDSFNRYRPIFLLADLPAPRSAVRGADDFPVPSDAPYSDSPWPQAAKNRAALITRIDGNIGRLMEELNLIELTNNVAIIFSSSAPPEKSSNTNLDFLKLNGDAPAEMDAAFTPLPMIIWWPRIVPAGRVSDVPWSNADIMPTLLEMVRGDKVPELDGVSRARTLRGLSETNRMEAPH